MTAYIDDLGNYCVLTVLDDKEIIKHAIMRFTCATNYIDILDICKSDVWYKNNRTIKEFVQFFL